MARQGEVFMECEKVADELQELELIVRTLNEESDGMNAIISARNASLASLNIGLEVWLAPDVDQYQIGFAKVDDKWQLAARCREAVVPLLQAPRELRIRSLDHWLNLVREMKQQAEARIKTIQEAKRSAIGQGF
jgi:hypothetical protein